MRYKLSNWKIIYLPRDAVLKRMRKINFLFHHKKIHSKCLQPLVFWGVHVCEDLFTLFHVCFDLYHGIYPWKLNHKTTYLETRLFWFLFHFTSNFCFSTSTRCLSTHSTHSHSKSLLKVKRKKENNKEREKTKVFDFWLFGPLKKIGLLKISALVTNGE